MADPEFVTLQVEDGVGTIRLDRPKMNAIDEQLHMEVRAAAMEASSREEIRAVVLYGGERVFAAGADIKAMSQLTGSSMVAWGRELTASFTEVARIPKPVIAAARTSRCSCSLIAFIFGRSRRMVPTPSSACRLTKSGMGEP